MMTHKEMIEVIAAHKDGRIIQYRRNGMEEHWQDTEPPCWAFNHYSYRAKPLTQPAKVTMWQWLWKWEGKSPQLSMGFFANDREAFASIIGKAGGCSLIGPAKWTEIEVNAKD